MCLALERQCVITYLMSFVDPEQLNARFISCMQRGCSICVLRKTAPSLMQLPCLLKYARCYISSPSSWDNTYISN